MTMLWCLVECARCGSEHRLHLDSEDVGAMPEDTEGAGAFRVNRANAAALTKRGLWRCPLQVGRPSRG